MSKPNNTPTLAILALCACGTAAALAHQQQTGVFRVTRDTVPIFATVTDRNDRLVAGLTRDDFQLFDNGKQQPLTLFDNAPAPVRLIVMLDVSGSMVGNLPLLREACAQLFSKLGPDDKARVGTFGKEVVISPTFTRDTRELQAALPTEIDPNAMTPLWRAIDSAMGALTGIEERRVVLVLSDGKDSGPQLGQKWIDQIQVVDRARRDEIMIYTIGLRSRMARPMMPGTDLMAMMAADLPDPGLGTAALDSGGGYFEIMPRDDLGAAFKRVVDELHSQYLLGFTPPARDGKEHKVEVKVGKRDLKTRSRKSYIAPKQ